MPRLAPKPLQLADPEREQLWQIVNRHRTPQQIALRARIILLADEGTIIEKSLVPSTSVERWLCCGVIVG
jgi:hypothetical protein